MACWDAPKTISLVFAFRALFDYSTVCLCYGMRNRVVCVCVLVLVCTVCDQVKMGVTAIFGPSDPLLGAHINSICDALDLPYLDARIDISPSDGQQQSTFGRHTASQHRFNDAASIVTPMENSYDDDSFASMTAATQSNSHAATKRSRQQLAIHLNPGQALINNAFKDVMRFLNWTKIAIIYEKRHGTYLFILFHSICIFCVCVCALCTFYRRDCAYKLG